MRLGLSLGIVRSIGAPGAPAVVASNVAFDAYTSPGGAIGTGNLSWTHTPVGAPKGVLVFVNQYFESTDHVTAVTYGGVALTRVDLAVFTGDNAVYAYFLGAGIPTGDQTVAVTAGTSAGNKRATCITVTADTDLSVMDSAKQAATASNPSVSLDITADAFVSAGITAEVAAVSQITEDAAYTLLYENDFGSSTMSMVRRTTNPTTGAIAVPFTLGSSAKFSLLAVAVG